MMDRDLNPIEPTRQELAEAHHWDELNKNGVTVFNSDELVRFVDCDKIAEDTLGDLQCEGLHDMIVQDPLNFIYDLGVSIEAVKKAAMESALKDFYGDI